MRAIVLRGAGDRAFVAGADIKEFPALRGGSEGGSARALQELGLRLETRPHAGDRGDPRLLPRRRSRARDGAATCGSCAEGAQLGQPEIKLGLIPGGGGTQRLPRLAGHGRAMLLNLTGDFVDAETAERWGIVDRVVPGETLLDEAVALADRIAAQSPHAVAVLKHVARMTRDATLEEGLRIEAEAFQRCLDSDDGAEGIAAFVEKRPPTFTGR